MFLLCMAEVLLGFTELKDIHNILEMTKRVFRVKLLYYSVSANVLAKKVNSFRVNNGIV